MLPRRFSTADEPPTHLDFLSPCPGQDTVVAWGSWEGNVRQGGRQQQQRRQRLLRVSLQQSLIDQPDCMGSCVGGKGDAFQHLQCLGNPRESQPRVVQDSLVPYQGLESQCNLSPRTSGDPLHAQTFCGQDSRLFSSCTDELVLLTLS